MEVTILSYKGNTFAVEPPTFVELEVTYTEPGFSGNTTTTSGNKNLWIYGKSLRKVI